MNVDVPQLAQVLTVIVVFVATLSVIGLVNKAVRRRIERGRGREADDGRLRRIEEAVDAIALEVERISEAQRFNSKLLSERPEPSERVLHR